MTRDDCRYVAEVTSSFRNAFWSHFSRTSSVASQSSSSGCDGSSPCEPNSSLVATMPMPKSCSQKRLAKTRAVSGLFSSTSQRASARRLAGALAAAAESSRASLVHFLAQIEIVAAMLQLRHAAFVRGSSFMIGTVAAGFMSASCFFSCASACRSGRRAGATREIVLLQFVLLRLRALAAGVLQNRQDRCPA